MTNPGTDRGRRVGKGGRGAATFTQCTSRRAHAMMRLEPGSRRARPRGHVGIYTVQSRKVSAAFAPPYVLRVILSEKHVGGINRRRYGASNRRRARVT